MILRAFTDLAGYRPHIYLFLNHISQRIVFQCAKSPLGSSLAREGQQMLSEAKATLDETRTLNPLFEDFDRYLESTSVKLFARTRIASIGFLLAGFASLLSAYIS